MTGKKSEHKAARKPGLPKPGRTARQKEVSPEEARIVLGILAEEAIDKTMRKLYPPRVVRADEKLPLALSGQEQKLLSDSLALFDLPKEQLELIEGGKESVIRLTLSDWDLFADSIAVGVQSLPGRTTAGSVACPPGPDTGHSRRAPGRGIVRRT